MGKTLYDKLWESHLVEARDDGTALIYIDRQLLHEVTSPQAFEGLRLAGRQPWRISANIAVPDHNVSTKAKERAQGLAGVKDQVSRIQLQTLDDNCAEYQIPEIPLNDVRQGIVHVMGPEQGATLPGMTIVCGDSHTSTHGAMAALAHGIGTSEVEHVLATGCLIQRKMKNFRVSVEGELPVGVTGKDIALAIVGEIGTAGGTGCAIEFAGSAVRGLTMEGRMTLCNMAIEAELVRAWLLLTTGRCDMCRKHPLRRGTLSGIKQRLTGVRCTATLTLFLIVRLFSMPPRFSLRSLGELRLKWSRRYLDEFLGPRKWRQTPPDRGWNARCLIWASNPECPLLT